MRISRKLGSVLVAMVLGTGAMNAMAQQASAPAAQSQGVLSGALTVGIPAGFEGSDLPENPGAPGAKGKMYINRSAKQLVLVTESPSGVKTGKNDPAFLNGAAQGFEAQQKRAEPSYARTGESVFTVGGIGVKRIDAMSKMNGQPVLLTSFFAAANDKLVVMNAYSAQKDAAGHEALTKALAGQLSAR